MSKATAEDAMRYHSEFVAGDNFKGRQRVTRSRWYLQGSKTGTYGDPTVASGETGRIIIDSAVAEGVRFLKEHWSHKLFHRRAVLLVQFVDTVWL
jgi:creatinine amidohydrolase/Fe(II)-dependent formamide hydrolase-like protein